MYIYPSMHPHPRLVSQPTQSLPTTGRKVSPRLNQAKPSGRRRSQVQALLVSLSMHPTRHAHRSALISKQLDRARRRVLKGPTIRPQQLLWR